MPESNRREIRRRSMQGTVLLLAGVIAAVAAFVTWSAWLVAVAILLLAPALVMLQRVGKALS